MQPEANLVFKKFENTVSGRKTRDTYRPRSWNELTLQFNRGLQNSVCTVNCPKTNFGDCDCE